MAATSQQSFVSAAMPLTIEEIRDDAIAGLVDQGFSRTDASAAVARSSSTDFSGVFRDGFLHQHADSHLVLIPAGGYANSSGASIQHWEIRKKFKMPSRWQRFVSWCKRL